MDNWLKPALDYILRWLDYQMRESEQPGCVIAIVYQAGVVLERLSVTPISTRGFL